MNNVHAAAAKSIKSAAPLKKTKNRADYPFLPPAFAASCLINWTTGSRLWIYAFAAFAALMTATTNDNNDYKDYKDNNVSKIAVFAIVIIVAVVDVIAVITVVASLSSLLSLLSLSSLLSFRRCRRCCRCRGCRLCRRCCRCCRCCRCRRFVVKAANSAKACSHRREPVVQLIKNEAAIAAAEMGNSLSTKRSRTRQGCSSPGGVN
jgi:hypothetical protein